MYLKSVEIVGFKSFADKTSLQFHQGVTAIVGPNGCGKSNVLDAIRWVLGEQSAKALRGGEMADVIFGGTDGRSPLGMAEVSLSFTDCEKELGVAWNEVQITRRVFRDGGSAYLLNGTPCRLRDIHQLFMDTGVGRSAYSIMEQGRIDQILSSRPEDRRAVFEEAAGITKFKAQKKEALRKLEATEANLLRVTDVVREVKRQIGSLQRQAAKARRYQALSADLATFETHFAHHQFQNLETAIARAKDEVARLDKERAAIEGEIDRRETSAADHRHRATEIEGALATARQAVQDLRNQSATADNRIAFNQERIDEAESLAGRYARDIAAAEEKLRVQETEIQHADLELEKIAETLRIDQSQLEEKAAAATAATAHRTTAENELRDTIQALARAENEARMGETGRQQATAARDETAGRLRTIGGEIAKASATVSRLEHQQAELAAAIARDTASVAAQQRQAAADDAAAAANRRDLDAATAAVAEARRRLAEHEARLDVLRQLNERGEGFTEGTQAVLRGLDNPDFFKAAIGGALATHLTVEPRYVAAIEAALGTNLQSVIVKDRQMAESIILTLTHQKLGRASLAVRDLAANLSALPSPAPAAAGAGDSRDDQAVPPPPGTLGWAIDQVTADATVEPLLRRLLRGVALVDGLATALELRQQAPAATAGITLATLAGEVLSPDGILHGGQAGQAASSVLGRKNEIAALAAAAAIIGTEIAVAVARQETLRGDLEAATQRAADGHAAVRQLEVALSGLRGQLNLADRELAEARRAADDLAREEQATGERHRRAAADLVRFDDEIAALAAAAGAFQTRRQELEVALDNLRARESAAAGELNDLRIQVATERQRRDSLANQRAPMAARLVELRELIGGRQRDIAEYRAKADGLAAEIAGLRTTIGEIAGRIATAEADVQALVAERAAVGADLEATDNELRIHRRQVADCQDRRGQQEVKQTQIQIRMENIREQVQRRHQVDLDAFTPDTYSLLCALRDQEKRLRKFAAAADNGTENGADGAADSGAEAAVASADDAPPPAPPEPAADAAADGSAGGATEPSAPIDWTRVEQFVQEITRRLDAMGPVNLDAIHEFDELEERYRFLDQQVTDLAAAKEELLGVIARINTDTRKMFAATFELVRANFQEMFTELFGGGTANLLLVDEADPLESGIDIIARPPGKQLQAISLLSGGEKAMTAVALLFAIYMVKPSPFCVLDEMDAPLDESNINRFIKILNRFVTQSQFVVITHSKRTIARADVIYGVTMEEHGVSKLVGVRFTQREQSAERTDIIGTANPTSAAAPSIAESFGRSDELKSERAG